MRQKKDIIFEIAITEENRIKLVLACILLLILLL